MRLGTWCEIPSAYVTHVMAKAGLDFMILDMEHGVVDFKTAQEMIFAAHAEFKRAFIRVPAIEEAYILRALDTGADGIVFPQVGTQEDIREIIRLSQYAPAGERGFNPYITAGGYTGVKGDFFARENRRVELCVILEGVEIFEHLESVLNFPEIGIYYIGQYDLSVALGVPGEVTHPRVLELMARAVAMIRGAGKEAGCMVHSAAEAKKVAAQGFEFLCYKADTGILFQSIHNFREEIEK